MSEKNEIVILGLDIGGANTKAALLVFKQLNILRSYSHIEYFPFWEKNIEDLAEMLSGIISNIVQKAEIYQKDLDYLSITITAELSDAFQTKKEGIITILEALEQVFDINKCLFINYNGMFVDFITAKTKPLSIAAANWVSTSLFLGKFQSNCILIDAGSTTIDIIPIVDSKPVAIGTDDITRLLNHELVYTGGLRATIPSITHHVPYKGNRVRISFEKFALASDVHRILDNISEKEYINDTADNRSKSLDDCYARLARIICMDLELISKDELKEIANYIYERQLGIIQEEIKIFYDNLITRHPQFKESPSYIITGSSADFLIRPCLDLLGFKNIKYYEKITKISDNISSSAFAVAGALCFQINK